MIIAHNMSSMNASRILAERTQETQGIAEKLASGLGIARAGDNASGLAVSEKMGSQIRGLNQANRNIQDGVSFIQTAEGALQETGDIIQRLRELAIQSANGIYTSEDRMQMSVEVSQLIDEIDRVASHAQFNGMNLLSGRFADEALSIHVGANVDQNVKINIKDMSTRGLGLRDDAGQGTTAVSLNSADDANRSLGSLDNALKLVLKQRADLGAVQNRFEFASKGVAIAAENTQAAESRIRDFDMARGMSDYTKNQILTQAGASMLAQANQNAQGILKLLG